MSDKNGIEQPKENWTRFPNCILDNLDRYNANEIKVLAFIIRKTLGWQSEPNYMFAAEYVAAKLDMSEKTARTAIDGLEQSGSIKNTGREGKMGVKLYKVNWIRPVKITDRIKGERPVKITGDARQNLPTVLETNHKETIQPIEDDKAVQSFINNLFKTIQDKTGMVLYKDFKLRAVLKRVIKTEKPEYIENVLHGYLNNDFMKKERAWNFTGFFSSKEKMEKHKSRSTLTTKCTLPDFSHIQYDDAPFDEHAMDEFKVTHA